MKLNNVPSNKFKITLIKMLIEVRRTMDEASDNLKNKRYKILKVQTEIMELQNNNQIGRIRYGSLGKEREKKNNYEKWQRCQLTP